MKLESSFATIRSMCGQRTTATAALLSLLATACGALLGPEQQLVEPLPAVARFERVESAEALAILLERDFSVPTHLRPCCAFGHDLEVRVTQLPVPLVALSNIADAQILGEHAFDGGLVSLRHGVRRAFVSREANGIVYTCRAGFIDTAHVRDYADWTVFLARRLEGTLATGVALELPEEGARRFVFVRALDRDLIYRVGVRALSARLAQRLAFRLSLWHETATWYGWSALPLFPERASAFSPEDVYSNLLGTQIASYLVQAGMAETEEAYDAAMDETIRETLAQLGAMPADATRRALDAVEGSWWSSKHRLPSPQVVLRRNLQLGPEVSPWTIPKQRLSPQLLQDRKRYCKDLPEGTVALRHPTEIEGISFADIASIQYRADRDLQRAIPVIGPGDPWLSDRDLPAIVDQIRKEGIAEFGPWHDQPDGGDGSP